MSFTIHEPSTLFCIDYLRQRTQAIPIFNNNKMKQAESSSR